MIKTSTIIFFVLHLAFGLYFVNYALNFVPAVNSLVGEFGKWIILVGGLFVLAGGVNILRLAKYKY